MKFFVLIFGILPFTLSAQFGFERNNDIAVIKNNLQQKFPWVGGIDYAQYSNIDLNQDGVQDLFIFDKTCDKPLTFIQNGQSGQIDFEYAPQYEKSIPKVTGWTLLADYNGDGKKDLFTSSPGGATVYKNISTPADGLVFTLASVYLPTTYLINGVTINTYVNVGQGDIPSISDVDNDGDLDLLAFYFNSSCVRYYRNMSQELYGNSDSLTFKTSSVCYGNFSESNTSNAINLNDCCPNQVDNPEFLLNLRPNQQNGDRHAGSSILSIDLDADGLEELIIGDISYDNMVRLMNDGNAPNTNANLVSPDYAFPSYDTPVDLTVFPAAYYVDINNDNVRDLMVSSNLPINSNNYRANWFYQNQGADNNPDFDLQTKGFFQDDMIDGGSESYPVYFDHNGDGIKDLIVAVADRFDSVSTNGYSQLFYYENTGSGANPEYTLITEDYGNFANFNNRKHYFYRPAFGDADGDGDEDLLLNDFDDTMYYFENISGAGAIAQFTNPTPFKNNLGQIIDEGTNSTPKFVDLNRDGRVDLVFGKRNGQLAYYENIGGVNAYSFEFKTGTLGNVDVSEYWTTEGSAVPEFIDIDNEYHLICGAKNGFLHYYNNIDDNLTGAFDLVDSTLHDIYIGTYSAPAVLDIDGDNRLEMLIGNKRGGLASYKSATVTDVGLAEKEPFEGLKIYPNPAGNHFFVDVSELQIGTVDQISFVLSDISGRNIKYGNINKTKTNIDCKYFTKGVYFLTIDMDGQKTSRKIVIN